MLALSPETPVAIAPSRRFVDEVAGGERRRDRSQACACHEVAVLRVEDRQHVGQQRRRVTPVTVDEMDQRLGPRSIGKLTSVERANLGATRGDPSPAVRDRRRARHGRLGAVSPWPAPGTASVPRLASGNPR